MEINKTMSFETSLGLRYPIFWGDWPIEESFARYLVHVVLTKKPVNIVEFGGGVSSLVMLKTLERLGSEYVFTSFDSDADFLEGTKNVLAAEGLYNERRVSLIHAPIADLEIDGVTYRWYDKNVIEDKFQNKSKIDLLFVDGPVGGFCKNARYPAMMAAENFLGKGSVLIMHDAKRPDEQEIVEKWRKENPAIREVFSINTERGGVEIRF